VPLEAGLDSAVRWYRDQRSWASTVNTQDI